MPGSKFLFVSYDGLIGDIAWQVVKEGHEVKLLDQGPGGARDRATASCRKTDDWRGEVDWADVVVFDDVLGHGRDGARSCARRGKLVVGGSPYTDRLEDDRAFGQHELKAAGVSIIPQENFTSFDDAIAYVQANPNRYVIKPSGEAQNYKRLLFVGEEEDGRDVVAGARGLQARLVGQDQGVPAPAAHHGRRGRDRRLLQRQGVRLRRSASTSSTRSSSRATSARPPARWARAMFWSEPNKIFNATLKKMEPKLAEEGYVGYIDVNCIVNATASIRWSSPRASAIPTISIQQEGLLTPIGELLRQAGRRARSRALRARSGFQVGVRVVVPPFPYTRPGDLREQLEGRGDPVQDARTARASTSRT